MSIEIRVDSTKVRELLRKAETATQKTLQEGKGLLAKAIYEESQLTVPVRTGRLKASGFWTGDGQVGYRAPYAAPVEFGTSRTAPRFFLAKAVAAVLSRAPQQLKELFERGVKS